MSLSKYGLIGEHLSHSYSAIIHNRLFKIHNIDANYELIEVSEDGLKDLVDSLRRGEYQGFNVTIPYKVKVMQYLDEVSSEALKVGAVNTIAYKDGKVIGYNTDYYGFLDTIKRHNIDCKNKNAYILGNGGACKACFSVLDDLGANVNIVSRSSHMSYGELEQLNDIYLMVNTTPVGMFPNVDNMPVKEEVKDKAKYIIDIIYNPIKTKLIDGKEQGYNGLYMLVSQAIKALEIWLDIRIDDKEDIYQYLKEVI